MFVRPQMYYYWIIAILSEQEWPDGDRILLRATLQHYWQHPWQLVRSTLQTYRGLTLGPPWTFTLVGYGIDAVGEQSVFFEPMHRDKGIIPTPGRHSVTATTLAVFANKAKPTPVWRCGLSAFLLQIISSWYPFLFSMVVGAVGFIGVPGAARTISLVNWGCI